MSDQTIPVGYKLTEVGMIPTDWEVKELGELCVKIQDGNYGESYPKSHEFIESGIPFLTSKAIGKDGVLKKDLIDYISLEKHLQLTKAHIEENDVLFTNRGASVGAIGYVSKEISGGNIGPQLTLLRSNSLLSSSYLYNFMKSNIFKNQIIGKDSGSAMNFFGIGQTKKFLIITPKSKNEQTRIATVLSDMDGLITHLDELIQKKKTIKQGALQLLLTPKKDWELKKLGEILDYEQPTPYLVKDTEYNDNNRIPVLTAGKTFVLGYTNENFGIFQKLPVIIFDDFTTATKYVDFAFKAKSSAMKMLLLRDDKYNLRLIYELMQTIVFPLGDHKRHWISEYSNIEIALPKIEEQNRIAAILSDIDNEIKELEQKKAKYEQLKQGAMQQLLTGKIRLVGNDK